MREVTIVTTCSLSLSLFLYSRQDDFRNYVLLSVSCNFVSVKALLTVRGIDPIASANKRVFFRFPRFVAFFFPPYLYLALLRRQSRRKSGKTLVPIESLSSVSPAREVYVDGSESPNTRQITTIKNEHEHEPERNGLLDALFKEDTSLQWPFHPTKDLGGEINEIRAARVNDSLFPRSEGKIAMSHEAMTA
jgi:hypothetical protein